MVLALVSGVAVPDELGGYAQAGQGPPGAGLGVFVVLQLGGPVLRVQGVLLVSLGGLLVGELYSVSAHTPVRVPGSGCCRALDLGYAGAGSAFRAVDEELRHLVEDGADGPFPQGEGNAVGWVGQLRAQPVGVAKPLDHAQPRVVRVPQADQPQVAVAHGLEGPGDVGGSAYRPSLRLSRLKPLVSK